MRSVNEVMNAFPVLIEQDLSLIDSFKIIRKKHLSHLLVVHHGVLVGVLSKEDLLNKILELTRDTTGKNYNEIILQTTPVSRIMSSELITASLEDLLSDTVDKMLNAGVHCIPVVNEDFQPVGILTPIDLLKAYSAGFENVG
jgi:acetoin utilization protein AcuB